VTRTAAAGLILVASMTLLLGLACAFFVDFDRAGWLGAGAGALLGLLNLAAGARMTRRALARGMQAAMRTLLGGFFARLLLVAVLIVVFHRTKQVDEVAFALVFLAFFFAYVALEVRLVERAGRTA